MSDEYTDIYGDIYGGDSEASPASEVPTPTRTARFRDGLRKRNPLHNTGWSYK